MADTTASSLSESDRELLSSAYQRAKERQEQWQPVRSVTCGHLRAAHNYNEDPRKEWTDEDIRLIAAAPEMLAALQKTIEYLRKDDSDEAIDLWVELKNVVRKAKGEQNAE